MHPGNRSTIAIMEDRGWGWTASKIRQVRLVEWLVPQSSSMAYVPVKPFYDAEPDQGALTVQVVHDELRELERQSLIDLAAGVGGVESYDARGTAEGRRLLEELRARRDDKRLRKIACRDAMVDWLYARNATSPMRDTARSGMLADPLRGTWLAESFSEDDLDAAAGWLERHRLVDGMTAWGEEGPVRLYLTDAGVTCAEESDSDTARFTALQQPNLTGVAVTQSVGTQVGFGNIQVNNYLGDPARGAEGGSEPGQRRGIAAASEVPAGPWPLCFPAQFTQRVVPLSNGLQTGTMLAIEVRAQRELEQATAVMTGVTGPEGADTIPPPVRLYWHPSREAATTVMQGAANLISVGRVGPLPPGAVMDTPDQDLPWVLPNGIWQVELQLTARRYPALHLTASFHVSKASSFPGQRIEWVTLTAAGPDARDRISRT
jgi:hypothetical protein